MDNRGEIHNEKRAKQLISFRGLRFAENITPTDIDGMIEYQNKLYVWLELKYKGAVLGIGQKIMLERLCNDLDKTGKKSLAIVSDHEVQDTTEQIIAADTVVRMYHFGGHWYFGNKNKPQTTKDLITRFINKFDTNIDRRNRDKV